jgi:hypothetical protein
VRSPFLFGHGHRAADVDHEIDAWCHFLAVETDGEHFGARIGGPVDVSQIVARRVGSIVFEFK